MSKRITSALLVVIMIFSLVAAVPAETKAVAAGDSGDSGGGSSGGGEGISSVKVSNVTTPVAGATPDYDISVTGTGVCLDDMGWYLASTGWDEVEKTGILTPGIYELEIGLVAEDGYKFTNDTRFYFGEELLPHEYDVEGKFDSCYYFVEEYEDYAEVYLYFVIEPKTGSTVTFDADGGSGTMASATNVKGFYTLPECGFTPPAGKAFDCWLVNDNRVYPGNAIYVGANTVVVAGWTKAVTLTFAAGGGSGTMAPATVAAGSYTLPGCSFTPPSGKTFKCWSVNGEEKKAGEHIYLYSSTTVTAVWTTLKGTISSVSILDIAEPVAGELPDVSSISINSYRMNLVYAGWNTPTGIPMGNSVRFQAGKTYQLVVRFDVAEGYQLADDFTVFHYLGGGTVIETSTSPYYVIISYTVPKTIPSVTISNLTTPVAGATPDYDITVSGTNAKIDYIDWWNYDPLSGWDELDETSIFAPGIYGVSVGLSGEDGYGCAEDTKFYFGNELLPSADYVEDEIYDSCYWVHGGGHAETYIAFVVEPAQVCTVTFEANGGSGTMAPDTNVKGFYNLPECGFTAPGGGRFKCWSIDGHNKYPGDLIFVGKNTTVTAVWYTEPITSVKISGVTAPVFGAAPDFNVTLTGTGASLYEGEEPAVMWMKFDPDLGTQEPVSESTPFTPGLYCIGIVVEAKDGYEFTEDSKFYFGDELLPPMDGGYHGCYEPDSQVVIIYYFFEVETVKISNINLIGILAPVDGEYPAVGLIGTDTPGISVVDSNWVTAGNQIMGNRIKFAAGQTYTLVVRYSLDEGYELAEGATLTYNLANGFNGKIAASSGTLTLQYTVPATATYMVTFAANGGSGSMAAITGVAGAYILPECRFTPPAGKQFKCWKIGRLLQIHAGSTITVTENIALTAVWEDIPDSATISGTITSYGSKTDNVTVHLISEGTSEVAYEIIVTGNIAAYSLTDVQSGTYTLRISKANHVTREYTLVVSGSAVTQDGKICLWGDANGDGKVNMKDWNRLYEHLTEVNELTGYEWKCADTTAEGKVNMKDWNRLYEHLSEVNLLW